MNAYLTHALTTILFAGLTTHAASADVLIIDAAGGGDYVDVQSAIWAASSGDVLLIKPGTYSNTSILIEGLSLDLVADGSPVRIGYTEVRYLAPGDEVVLMGLEILYAATTTNNSSLSLHDNQGSVRVQDCTIHGGGNLLDAGSLVLRCDDVVFTRCEIGGSRGFGMLTDGRDGGLGLEARDSTIALHDSTISGGRGGDGEANCFITQHADGGDGGRGAVFVDSDLMAMGCSFEGGDGGSAECCGSYSADGGNGGYGLLLSSMVHGRLADTTFIGGMGQPGCGSQGHDGLDGQDLIGTPDLLTPLARTLSGPNLVRGGSSSPLDIAGEVGDRVWLVRGQGFAQRYLPFLQSTFLLGRPMLLTISPMGTIDATGSLRLQQFFADVAGPQLSRRIFMQLLIKDAGGQPSFGSLLMTRVIHSSL